VDLSDVERGDLARIPGGVYIRGYITSFARALNLDGEKLWTEYLAESNSIPEPVSPSPPPVTDSTIPRWSFVVPARSFSSPAPSPTTQLVTTPTRSFAV
jgi:hypothetical protein